MKSLHVSILALASAVPLPVLAQDVVLDEIIVTANRTETDRSRTGTSVSVVEAADQGPAREVGIADAFSRLAGVSVTQQGPFGSPVSLRIRGADQRYIAVFVDGIRVSDPTGVQTEFDFGMLPGIGVDRIEILRGSQSALWGGSAVGGVVSITSPRPTEDGTRQEVQAEAGSFGTANLRYTLTQKTGDLETALTLSHLRTDGFSAAATGTERDGAEATRLSTSLRYQVSDTLAVGGAIFSQRLRSEFDGFVFTPPVFGLVDLPNEKKVTETGLRTFAELDIDNTRHIFDVTRYQIGRDITDENGVRGFDGNRTTASWQATTDVSPVLQLVYGADVMNERARYPTIAGGRAKTTISGAFGQALWSVTPDLDVAATVRRDDHSAFGTFDTGRLAVAWRPTAATTLRFAAATGFRAPSIDELFGAYPEQFFVGNSGLTPETSDSFELGVEHLFANGAVVSATAFRLNIEDQIRFYCPDVNDSGTPDDTADDFCNVLFTLENRLGLTVRQGVELTADVPVSDSVRLGLAYTYTDTRGGDGARINLVPYHDLSASLTADLSPDLVGGITVKHVSGSLDGFNPALLPDYTTVKATLDYDLGQGKSAYLRVENLFDTDYQTSQGYAASGRAVFAGLRASF